MPVYSIQVLRKNADGTATILKTAVELSPFSFFQRASVQEFMSFTGDLLVARTATGARRTVRENEYYCHIHVRPDGLAGVAITDSRYNDLVAFSMLKRMLDGFVHNTPNWPAIPNEASCNYDGLPAFLTNYQNPGPAEQRIEPEVTQAQITLHNTIQSVLNPGEILDTLIRDSNILTDQSKMFYTQARHMNRCCNWI